MPKTCIHIGLPKAASTYLQYHVQSHDAISLVGHDQLKLLRLAAMGEHDADRAIAMLSEEAEARWRDRALCLISDERLSSWRHFDFRFLPQNQVLAYQRRCSEMLARVFAPAKILLLARNPRDWLRSVYGQYVKAGEGLSLTEFCLQNEGYLLQASRLDDLARIYTDAFGPNTVEIFPIEAMGTGKSVDWRDWFNQAFNLDIDWSQESCYQRLDEKTMEAIRKGNRVIDRLGRSAGIKDARLREFKNQVFRFLDTTLVDHPENQKLLRRLAGALPEQSSLPEAMVGRILNGMSSTIKRRTFDTVRDLYS